MDCYREIVGNLKLLLDNIFQFFLDCYSLDSIESIDSMTLRAFNSFWIVTDRMVTIYTVLDLIFQFFLDCYTPSGSSHGLDHLSFNSFWIVTRGRERGVRRLRGLSILFGLLLIDYKELMASSDEVDFQFFLDCYKLVNNTTLYAELPWNFQFFLDCYCKKRWARRVKPKNSTFNSFWIVTEDLRAIIPKGETRLSILFGLLH